MYTRHKRPLVIGVAIVGLALLVSTSTYIVSSFIKNDSTDPIKPDDKELDELIKRYNKCKEEKKDPLVVFTVNELANITIRKFKKIDSFLTIGNGSSSNVSTVTVTNCLIKTKSRSFEESISFSEGVAGLFANSKREYMSDSVESYTGKSNSDRFRANWDKDSKVTATKKDFENEVGKLPSDPFAYDITADTVLEDSTKEKDGEGYKLFLNLEPSKSTTRYAKRMRHMSGLTPDSFSLINITFYTDNDFNIKKSEVEEHYIIAGFVSSIGKMNTDYYSTNIPTIPEINQDFDYSPYLK